MERGEELDTCNEDIDDFYVVDSWSENPSSDFQFKSSPSDNIYSKEDKLSRRKPTEGEIDEFLENLKQSKSKCGTSGLEGSVSNSFDSGDRSGSLIKIQEGSSRDKLFKCQAAKQSSQPVNRFKHSIVSYKPGETLTKTFFREASFNDLSRSINNNQDINIPSTDSVLHNSIDWNEDSGGGFSDLKGSRLNGPHDPTSMESSSRHLRRGRSRSRSPHSSSTSRYPPVRENTRFPPREGGRNHSNFDSFRTDRNVIQNSRHHDDIRRKRRSRSNSRERKLHRRRSFERRSSHSPSPRPKRESGNQSGMESRQVPYYPSSGASMPPATSFMNPNPNFGLSTHGPVQYPINAVSSNTSYGGYPGYNVPVNNMFNGGSTHPPPFQPPMTQNFPQNQYPNPQNYNLCPPVMQGNPPNPVSYPSAWNQPSVGFNQNYSVPNVSSTDAVMYPHLKIGQSRVDSNKNSYRESTDKSMPLKHSRSSLERRIRSKSRSPDPKKHKRKTSKRYSKSPSLDHMFEDSDKRYARHSKSPVRTYRYESKKAKLVIDPHQIPSPPPPPILGSYNNDEPKKSVEKQKVKTKDGCSDIDPLSEFLNKEKVSLSCLLEAVMETSGQGKSQLSDPKVKKEIISNCESKIQHLYKRRMTGLGAFIPDPVHSSHVITHASPLVTVYSPFSYNCEEENNEWHCPDIVVPELKIKKDLKVPVNDISTSQKPFEAASSRLKTNLENPMAVPTLSSNQLMPESNWNANNPDHVPQRMYPYTYNNNQQSMFPSHQGSQTWSNPVQSQNPYAAQPPGTGPTNELANLGPTPYISPSYPFPHRPPAPQFVPQQRYPPQPEMVNYPTRINHTSMHHFLPQNFNQPGMFSAPQPDLLNRSNYQYNADEPQKSRKNKNMVNENLILLSRNSGSHSSVHQDKKERNQNDILLEITDNPKDKLLKKGLKLRKSSEYDQVPSDVQDAKEHKDKFYNKLNYSEMLEDTHLDTMPDYQLTSLKERIETCLAEGKSSPGRSRHRSRDRRQEDRERHKDRDRGRERIRDSERPRRGSLEGERKWHVDERKKYKSAEGHGNHEVVRKNKESSDKKDHKLSSREDVIEILSDEDQNKTKLSDSSANEGLMDSDEPLKSPENPLVSLIFDSLGPEIRKIQEKSDLYQSIISSLDKGDKAYKRLYSFRNNALMKSDKDSKMKMVIPRDSLKEIVTLIHKNFHHVQSEELSRVLKSISYPFLLYIPKCVSKVMSDCPMCVEENKRKEGPLIDKQSERTEIKPVKRNNRLLKDGDKERYKRVSKDRSSSSSSKGRRDHLRSGREKDKKDLVAIDGTPSGYEKATKIRKLEVSLCTKSNHVPPDKQCLEEKPSPKIDVKSSELIKGLSDKALEFKQNSECVKNVSEDGTNVSGGINKKNLPCLVEKDYEKTSNLREVCKKDSEDKVQDPEIKLSDVTKPVVESFRTVKKSEESFNTATNPEMGSSNPVTKTEVESSNTDSKTEMKCSNTMKKPETESSSTVSKTVMESSNTVSKTEMESSSTVSKTEIESSNKVSKTEMESSNTVTKTEMESSNTVTKTEMESSSNVTKCEIESPSQVPNPHLSKQVNISTSESSNSFEVDSVDKNQKPSVSSSNTVFELNKHSNNLVKQSKESNIGEEKASINETVNAVDSKATPKLDFKGRVRQVQMSSNECKNIIKELESKDVTIATDPSYLMKGGMLCRKDNTGNTIEVKIVVPSDELEKVVNIVHTMSAIHTPPAKVVAFFSKHFTQVENLELRVNEIVGNCSYCKLKSR